MQRRIIGAALCALALVTLLSGCGPVESEYERLCREAYEQLQNAPAVYIERRFQLTRYGEIINTYEVGYWMAGDDLYALCTDVDSGGTQEETLYFEGQYYNRNPAEDGQWQKGMGIMPKLSWIGQDWKEMTGLFVPRLEQTDSGMMVYFSCKTTYSGYPPGRSNLSRVFFYFDERDNLTGITFTDTDYSGDEITWHAIDRNEILSMDETAIRQTIDAHGAEYP